MSLWGEACTEGGLRPQVPASGLVLLLLQPLGLPGPGPQAPPVSSGLWCRLGYSLVTVRWAELEEGRWEEALGRVWPGS